MFPRATCTANVQQLLLSRRAQQERRSRTAPTNAGHEELYLYWDLLSLVEERKDDSLPLIDIRQQPCVMMATAGETVGKQLLLMLSMVTSMAEHHGTKN